MAWLNPKFTLDELRFQVNDSKPTVLVAVKDFAGNDLSETISTLTKDYSSIKRLLVIGGNVPGAEEYAAFINKPRENLNTELEKRASAVNQKDSALLMYTSGSTGKPKGVLHTHYCIIENIKVEEKKFYFHQGGRVLLHFLINHVAADVEIGFAAIMVGGCIVCMDRFDPAASLVMVEKENQRSTSSEHFCHC